MKNMKIGISRCLLGENVRYDGQHKLDHYLKDELGKYVDYVGICPEVECGMSAPREAMHLEFTEDGNVSLVITKSNVEKTLQMQQWLNDGEKKLISEDICGLIVKSKSPSCGMMMVKIYNKTSVEKSGRGIFTEHMIKNYPWLPVEEEGRLHDYVLRENFIDRIFMLWRWKRMIARKGEALEKLKHFHAENYYLLCTHSREDADALEKLCEVATIKDIDGSYVRYFHGLMNIMKINATVSKKVEVMQEMSSSFYHMLSHFETKELKLEIDKFARHFVPEIVPITLIKHYTKKFRLVKLIRQSYLKCHSYKSKLINYI